MGDITGAVAEALGRLGDEEVISQLVVIRDQLEKKKTLLYEFIKNDITRTVCWLLVKADLAEVRGLLKSKNRDFRTRAAVALGRRGDKEAVPTLLEMLAHNPDPVEQSLAFEALGQLRAEETIRPLLDLLRDDDLSIPREAADALGCFGTEGGKEAIRPLLDLLRDKKPSTRAAAARVLGLLGAKEAIRPLRELLQDNLLIVNQEVGLALARLGAKDSIEWLINCLINPESHTVGLGLPYQFMYEVRPCLEGLRPQSILIFLKLPYIYTPSHVDARWLAHYHGGGTVEAEIFCGYLGSPASDPKLPTTPAEARETLKVLDKVWDVSQSRWLREDAAGWMSFIITQQVKEWTSGDVPILKQSRDRLRKDEMNKRGLAYADVIEQIIAQLRASAASLGTLGYRGAHRQRPSHSSDRVESGSGWPGAMDTVPRLCGRRRGQLACQRYESVPARSLVTGQSAGRRACRAAWVVPGLAWSPAQGSQDRAAEPRCRPPGFVGTL